MKQAVSLRAKPDPPAKSIKAKPDPKAVSLRPGAGLEGRLLDILSGREPEPGEVNENERK